MRTMSNDNGKRPAAQLNREIAESLAKRGAGTNFHDLIRDDDPGGMQLAEDFLLERGWKMREATGGMRARNFTIEMKPMYGPLEQWKMVQMRVYAATDPRRGYAEKPGLMEVSLSVANGEVRLERGYKIKAEADSAKQQAVATAWAIAKAIKPLPLNTSEKALAHIVDAVVAKKKKNLRPEELF